MPRTAASTAGLFSHATTAGSRLRPGHQPARSRAARTSGGKRVAAARCAVYWAATSSAGSDPHGVTSPVSLSMTAVDRPTVDGGADGSTGSGSVRHTM